MTFRKIGKVEEAPVDGNTHGRKDAEWVEIGSEVGGDIGHQNLLNLQGGSATERYHLTAAQQERAIREANASQNGLLSVADHALFSDKYTKDEVEALIAEGYKRVDINSSLDLTGESVNKTIYAVVIGAEDITITLPASVVANEGDTCYIYIEHTANTNKLIVKASSADTIRGNNTKEFDVQYDGFHIAAHQYVTPHWDVLGWMIDSRTDEVKYIAGNDGVESIETLQDLLNHTLSSSLISGGEVTVNVDGTISVAQSEWLLRIADTPSSECRIYKIPAQENITVPDLAVSYLVADYNSGSPTYSIESDITTIQCRSKCVQGVFFRRGVNVDYLSIGQTVTDFPSLYAVKQANTAWLERATGLLITSNSALEIDISSGIVYNGVTRYGVVALTMDTDNSAEWWWNNGSWQVDTRTAIDNTQYNDFGTGKVTLANTNRYSSHFVYAVVNNPSRMLVVYSQEEYTTLNAARNAQPPIDANLPPICRKFGCAVLVGKIVIGLNSTSPEALSPFGITFSFTTDPV